MSVQVVTIPVFDVNVHMTNSREDAKAFLRQWSSAGDEDKVDAPDRGFCDMPINEKGLPKWLMCCFEGGLPILVHEAVHMAGMTLKRIGVPVSVPRNDEALAYLTAYLVEEFLRRFPMEAP